MTPLVIWETAQFKGKKAERYFYFCSYLILAAGPFLLFYRTLTYTGCYTVLASDSNKNIWDIKKYHMISYGSHLFPLPPYHTIMGFLFITGLSLSYKTGHYCESHSYLHRGKFILGYMCWDRNWDQMRRSAKPACHCPDGIFLNNQQSI